MCKNTNLFYLRKKKHADSTTISGCKRWVIVVLSAYYHLLFFNCFLSIIHEIHLIDLIILPLLKVNLAFDEGFNFVWKIGIDIVFGH